ncbi:MAG TPA: MarR family transcriptional regulator [Chloroflexia bacterium]|nr:MarR family transcriptional regulator [Chloroflexia bacterium]
MLNDVTMEDWALLAQVSQAYRSLSDAFMEQVTMHRAQATLLCKLFVRDGMTQTEIAEQLSVQGATVTNMLQRIEEAGLVARRRDPDDNRLVRVYLTELGREKEQSINEQFARLQETIFRGISEEERAALRQIYRKMLQNMGDETA